MPMDLVAVDTIGGRLYSFLSVTWAIIADVDIESEKFRSLGGARFTVMAINRIISTFSRAAAQTQLTSFDVCQFQFL